MEGNSPLPPPALPRKRLKLHHTPDMAAPNDLSQTVEEKVAARLREIEILKATGNTLEDHFSITEFASPQGTAFKGAIKQRYTDFLVNEILLSGETVHLTEVNKPDKFVRSKERANKDSDVTDPKEPSLKKTVGLEQPTGQPEETAYVSAADPEVASCPNKHLVQGSVVKKADSALAVGSAVTDPKYPSPSASGQDQPMDMAEGSASVRFVSDSEPQTSSNTDFRDSRPQATNNALAVISNVAKHEESSANASGQDQPMEQPGGSPMEISIEASFVQQRDSAPAGTELQQTPPKAGGQTPHALHYEGSARPSPEPMWSSPMAGIQNSLAHHFEAPAPLPPHMRVTETLPPQKRRASPDPSNQVQSDAPTTGNKRTKFRQMFITGNGVHDSRPITKEEHLENLRKIQEEFRQQCAKVAEQASSGQRQPQATLKPQNYEGAVNAWETYAVETGGEVKRRIQRKGNPSSQDNVPLKPRRPGRGMIQPAEKMPHTGKEIQQEAYETSPEEKLRMQQKSIPSSQVETPLKPRRPGMGMIQPVEKMPRTGKEIQQKEKESLTAFFPLDFVNSMVRLYEAIIAKPDLPAKDHNNIISDPVERGMRRQAHEAIRHIFDGKLDSQTDKDGHLQISALSIQTKPRVKKPSNFSKPRPKPKLQSKAAKQSATGDRVLHFTMYKENRDTMEVVRRLANELRISHKAISFAGTKDRRAVTVQQLSVNNVTAERVRRAGNNLRGVWVGHFECQPQGLQLGDLAGNSFVITIRDCNFGSAKTAGDESRLRDAHLIVGQAVEQLNTRGFINYFGLQRFGTFSMNNDIVGLRILQGLYSYALIHLLQEWPSYALTENGLLDSEKWAPDDQARQKGIQTFDVEQIPRKFVAERNAINHLVRRHEHDWLGAILAIPHNIRQLYLHAFQSAIWNYAATFRWEKFGAKVVEGDLVLINEHEEDTSTGLSEAPQVDDEGEIIVRPSDNGQSTAPSDRFTRARHLTKEEAESGKYSIYDVVLPLPGYDVLYPNNILRDHYRQSMAMMPNGPLDPFNMRRSLSEFSLSGSYRKVMALPRAPVQYKLFQYEKEQEQFAKTDLDVYYNSHPEGAPGRLSKPSRGSPGEAKSPEYAPSSSSDSDDGNGVRLPAPKKLAVVVEMALGSSQYATVALRELMKGGGKEVKGGMKGC